MFLQTTYKVQEMLRVGTRHKVSHLLTQGVAVVQGFYQAPPSLPKTYIPEWQQMPGSKPPITTFFGCLKYKHILRFPSLAVIPPTWWETSAQTLAQFPLRIMYRTPTDTYKLDEINGSLRFQI